MTYSNSDNGNRFLIVENLDLGMCDLLLPQIQRRKSYDLKTKLKAIEAVKIEQINYKTAELVIKKTARKIMFVDNEFY